MVKTKDIEMKFRNDLVVDTIVKIRKEQHLLTNFIY
jgi:hypothetical protein